MITYDPSKIWPTVCSMAGSVVPKALKVALPAAILALVWGYCYRRFLEPHLTFGDVDGINSGFTLVLGFLLVYRAQIAYNRFWDGASYLQSIKSGWFNATTSLFAFCSEREEKEAAVQHFQHQLVRMISMMYSAALQIVAGEDSDFEVIDYGGIEEQYLKWAVRQHDRLEVIMSWTQRLIVHAHRRTVIDIAPPILSRVFQELSNGMIDVSNAKRINKFPFPFPYAQMIWLMLFSHFLTTVFISGIAKSPVSAFIYSFCSVLSLWSINWIAIEIEMPFGTDANDLPMAAMQKSMNDCLVLLLHPNCQHIPQMAPIREEHLNVGLKSFSRQNAERLETYNAAGELRYQLGQAVAQKDLSINKTPRTSFLGQPYDDAEVPLQDVVRALDKHVEAVTLMHENHKVFAAELAFLRKGNEEILQHACASKPSKTSAFAPSTSNSVNHVTNRDSKPSAFAPNTGNSVNHAISQDSAFAPNTSSPINQVISRASESDIQGATSMNLLQSCASPMWSRRDGSLSSFTGEIT